MGLVFHRAFGSLLSVVIYFLVVDVISMQIVYFNYIFKIKDCNYGLKLNRSG